MAKKIKGGSVEFEVSDGGSLKKLEKNSKRAGEALGSVAKNAQEADRRLKGTANMSSNSTKNFAKQAQSISGGLVPAYATLAAQVFAVSAAFEFLKSAFNTRNLIEGQKAFSAVTGVAYRALTKDIKAATQGMLSFEEAAQAAAIGTAAGLSRGQLTAIGKAATDVSLALGRDLTDSFNRLTRGITKAEPELLDELGIVLRLDPAMKNYASSVGKAVADLTQFERSQAIANEVLGQAETKFGAIQKIMDPSAFALGQFSAAFNDLMVEFKVGVVEFLTPVIQFLTKNVEALIGALALGLAPVLRSILPDFKEMGRVANSASRAASAAAERATANAELYRQRAAAASGETRPGLMKASQRDAKSLGIGLKGTGDQAGMLSNRQLAIYKNQLDNQKLLEKKYTKEQIKTFRSFIITQEALIKGRYEKETGLRKKNEFDEKATYARRRATMQAFYAGATRIVGAFATTANLLLTGIGWLGTASLIVSATMAAYAFFNPPDEKSTKLGKKLNEIRESTTELTQDFLKMAEVQRAGLLNLTGFTEQRGQAAASGDIRQLIRDFNLAQKSGDVNTATKVAESIRALNIVLGTTLISKDQLNTALATGIGISASMSEEAGILADKYIAAGQATKQFAQDQQALTNAIAGATKVSLPFTNIATAFSASIQSLRTSMSMDPQSMEAYRRSIDAAAQEIAEIDKRIPGLEASYNRAVKTGGDEEKRLRELNSAKFEREEAEKRLEELKKGEADQVALMEKREKLLKSFEANEAFILMYQDKGLALQKERLDIDMAAAKLPLNNEVGTKNAKEDLKVRTALANVKEAEIAHGIANLDLEIKSSTATKQQLRQLNMAVEISGKQLLLERQKAEVVKRQVALQKMLNTFADRRRTLELNTARTNLQLQKERNKDALARGVAGSRAALRNLQSNELARLMQDQLMAETALRNNASERAEIEALSGQARIDAQEKYQELLREEITLQGKVEEALQKVRMARQALSSEGFFAQQGLLADARQAQLSVGQNVGMLGRATVQGDEFTRQALALMESQGYTNLSEASAEERERLKNTVQEATVARIELGMMQETSAAIGSAFSGLFDSLLDGTKSLKQALGDMMKQLLSDLAQAYLKAAMLQAISGMGFGLPGARYGGIMSPSGKSFAVGGIASGPTSGYMATLHGTEAVVPLGNDRSIPVELKGGGGSNVVNVSVNVAADGQSNVSAQGGNMEGLGKVIGQAVQQELMRQKRPGGMLSPYGAA